jgi:hypothetical protein
MAPIVACFAAKKVKQTLVITSMAIGVVFSACSSSSSPEADGIKAAQMRYKYENDYIQKHNAIIKEQNKAVELYIKNFNFKTRSEARVKLNDLQKKSEEPLNKLNEEASEWNKKVTDYYQELRSKYVTNQENAEKFQYAFDKYEPKERVTKEQGDYNNSQKAWSMVFAIIPPNPDVERMKNDLVGKTFQELIQRSGYGMGYQTYNHTINSVSDIKGFEIENANVSGTHYTIHVRLRFHDVYQGNVILTYVLNQQDDDWYFQRIVSGGVGNSLR